MKSKDVRVLGLSLIFIGFLGIIYTTGLHEQIVTGYQAAMGYPLSVKSPEEKISPLLKKEIAKVSPTQRIPVVIVLTAPPGGLAAAQQRDILPTLQVAGFQLTMSTIQLTNTLAGTIPAGKIHEIAINPNIDEILYDGMFFTIDDLHLPSIKFLKDSVPQIGADKAWEQGYKGQGVTVIVIDTGIQNNHPWLQRNGKSLVLKEYVTAPGENDYSHWHGTHVAGIVASQHETYKGVAPDIKGFIDIIAFNSNGQAALSWILAALDKAYEEAKAIKAMGEPVVSTNSWGAPPSNTPEVNKIREAALKLADEIPVVFAAGNSGPRPGTIGAPGDADKEGNEIITVGAVDKSDNIAFFSSRGPDRWGQEHNEPDVSAPGVRIYSSMPGKGGGYASGTSMATPHVAGTVALMLSKNPQLSNIDCLNYLMKSAKDRGDPGFDYAYGAGIIQADKAVALVPSPGLSPPHVPSIVWQVAAVLVLLIGILLTVDPEIIPRARGM